MSKQVSKKETEIKQTKQFVLLNHKKECLLDIWGKFTLIPGYNVVNKNDWEVVKDDKLISFRVENDMLGVETGFSDFEGNENSPLEGFTKERAKFIVENTFSTQILKDWQAREKNKDLREIMDKQINALLSKEN